MSAILKLVTYVGGAFAAYEGYLWWRKKNSFTPLSPGQGYTVVLDYTGAGVGGPLSIPEVQGYLDAAGDIYPTSGREMFTVTSTDTDPVKKTITYNIMVNGSGIGAQPVKGTSDVLAPKTFPSAYGRLSVALVQATGASQ